MTREELRAIICEAIGDSSRVDPLLSALEAAGVRLVPAEATQDMTGAVLEPTALRWDVMKTYAAMIAASPYAAKRAQLIDGDERTTVRIFTPYASE